MWNMTDSIWMYDCILVETALAQTTNRGRDIISFLCNFNSSNLFTFQLLVRPTRFLLFHWLRYRDEVFLPCTCGSAAMPSHSQESVSFVNVLAQNDGLHLSYLRSDTLDIMKQCEFFQAYTTWKRPTSLRFCCRKYKKHSQSVYYGDLGHFSLDTFRWTVIKMTQRAVYPLATNCSTITGFNRLWQLRLNESCTCCSEKCVCGGGTICRRPFLHICHKQVNRVNSAVKCCGQEQRSQKGVWVFN